MNQMNEMNQINTVATSSDFFSGLPLIWAASSLSYPLLPRL